jgi:hypothetical protein
MGLNAKQVEQLLRPVNPRRVQKDNSGMSHLAGYDVSAHLTRIFGFGGWEKKIRALELVSEHGTEKNGRTGWWVTYRCLMTLDVKDPAGNLVWSNDDGATGSASNLPSKGDAHDFAMKNAITYALKRCAKDLGDQFGLSLYNHGSLEPLIVRTLAADGKDAAADVEKDIPGELHPDTDDTVPSEPPAEQPTPPAANGTASNGRAANGTAVRPAQATRPAPAQNGEADPDAQPFADEAHQALVVATLKDINTRAREAHKLAALIRNPSTGGIGGLGQYLNYRRGVLQKAESALGDLKVAATTAGIDETEMERRLVAACGHGIEAASAEDMIKAAELILKGAGTVAAA